MKAPPNNLQRELEQAQKALARCKACMRALLDNWDDVEAIKQAICDEDLIYAQGMWDDLELKDTEALMIAPTKGGCFTTKERAIIPEFWREQGI